MQADRPLPTAHQVLEDPAASRWLKQAVHTGLARDPVDVAADAELLAGVFSQRALDILNR